MVNFVANQWQEAWFSGQKYDDKINQSLYKGICELNCPAKKCFETHWSSEYSKIDVPRTNIVAERCVKLMEELNETSKCDKYLNLKFVATNII